MGVFIFLSSVSTQPGRAEQFYDEEPTSPNTPTTIFFPVVQRQNPAPEPVGNIVIDHTSIALFDRIPERYITAAKNLRLLFSDRSVGQNIHDALDCLVAASWDSSQADCRRDYYNASWDWKTYGLADLNNGTVPTRILFEPDPFKYNRNNWRYEYRQGTWSELTQNFIQELAPAYINSSDVLSYQFSYLNINESDNIDDPQTGFFANNPTHYDIYDLEAYIARYPNKIFFFWTTSLARSIGTDVGVNFNNHMRQYARDHNKILFDVADIQAHTEQGTPCFDNRDGVQYCTQNGVCENYPNDRLNIPAICQDYTTEVDGGHLGSVSAGKIRLAKAFWVLMARIAGWDGQSP